MNKIGAIVLLIIIGLVVLKIDHFNFKSIKDKVEPIIKEVKNEAGNVLEEANAANSNKSKDSEASKIIADYWNSISIICGGDYYFARFYKSYSYGDSGELRYRIWQYRGVKYNLVNQSDDTYNGLSETDRLNGFEYKGYTTVDCRVKRVFLSRTNSWKDWVTCGTYDEDFPSLHFTIYKKDGVWVYLTNSTVDKYKPIPNGKPIGTLLDKNKEEFFKPYTLDQSSYLKFECSDIPKEFESNKEMSFASSKKSMNSEATKVVTDYWNSILKKCGDDYYSAYIVNAHHFKHYKELPKNPDYKIVQYRGVRYRTIDYSANLSEADKSNGLEYEGDAGVECKFERVFSSRSNSWGDWKDCGSKNKDGFGLTNFHLTLYKKRGVWVYLNRDDYKYKPLPTGKDLLIKNKGMHPMERFHNKSFECSDIPE